MKKIILMLGIVIVLVAGCDSSFQDCKQSCFWTFNKDDKFQYNATCDGRSLFDMINNSEPQYYTCIKTDNDKVRDFCFNECKPK